MRPNPARPIALIGLMGAGKTTVARHLGERLAVSMADLDALIAADGGQTIAELFASEGEPAFRRRETRTLRRALDAGARVIACGGGVITEPASAELLRERCSVVWLEVSPAEAARRIGEAAAARPLIAGQPLVERLASLASERHDACAAAADVRVRTDGRTSVQVAAAVLDALAAAP